MSIKHSKSESMKSDGGIALGFEYMQNIQLSGIHAQKVVCGQWFLTYPEAGYNIGYNPRGLHKIIGIVLER